MQQMIFIADLIACSTCFGHHYAHHQELERIIEVVAACGVWFAGCLQQPANRTHNPQLHTIPTT
jgi:alkylhydroperoxidase family enzyme